jgi:putative membrane protein
VEIQPTRSDPDSRARTHLANERTFLAWLRTGVTLIALGIAAAQFLSHDTVPGVPLARVLATILIVTGVALVAVGAVRYSTGRERIERGSFAPAWRSVVAAAGVAALTGGLAVVFVWLLPR